MSLSAELTRSINMLSPQQWLADVPACTELFYKGWKVSKKQCRVLERILPTF